MRGRSCMMGLVRVLCVLLCVWTQRQVLAQEGEATTRDNVVILLDASGSMKEPMKGGRRIDVAKRSLLSVLERVSPTTNVGVLVFSGSGRSGPWWLAQLGPLDLERVRSDLAKLEPDGGTPLGATMQVAADRLLAQRTSQLGYGTFRLLILSDGEASDQALVDRHLPEILRDGLRTDVIGLEMKSTHSLATRVNSYRAAGSGDELSGAIQAVFAEIGSAGRDATDPELYQLASSLSAEGAMAVLSTLKPAQRASITAAAQAVPGVDVAVSGRVSGRVPGADQGPVSGGVQPASQGGRFWSRVLGLGGIACFLAGMVVIAALVSLARRASSAGLRVGKSQQRWGGR